MNQAPDPREGSDLHEPAARLLDEIEGRLRAGVEDASGALDAALAGFWHRAVAWVRRYHRLQIDVEVGPLPDPVLFVANHGFGGIFDLNVLAANAALEDLALDRPVTFLTHQLAWTLGVGPVIEHLGARPASTDSAARALAEGHHVMVFPGGDIDAGKSWSHRNEIVFAGRTGFARFAMDRGLPVVPIVTAGAGESLLVLSDGKPLARALRLDRILRVKALPVSVSLPWGLNVGVVGMAPYLPLPTKLRTRVLPARAARPDDDAESFADRVRTVMQDALTEMTAHRRPVLG